MASSCFQIDLKGIRLSLYAQPGASKSAFAGLHGEALKLRVAARAEDGEANKAICVFLAEFFEVSKSSVSILRGETSRLKIILIEGNSAALSERLPKALDDT